MIDCVPQRRPYIQHIQHQLVEASDDFRQVSDQAETERENTGLDN